MTTLNALCPLDGRYQADIKELAAQFSEKEFLRLRILIEIEYLIALESEHVVRYTPRERTLLRTAYLQFTDRDARIIKRIETLGVKGINKGKRTDHDVKAIELYLRWRFRSSSLRNRLEFFHICLTSEDVNNLALSLMIQQTVQKHIIPSLLTVLTSLIQFVHTYGDVPMPARTHGQYAVPTTMGKEFSLFAVRLSTELNNLSAMTLPGKLNGAVGNFNAHRTAFPAIDWMRFSKTFVESLGLSYNPFSTQIEPHDSLSNLLYSLKHINCILLDVVQDVWGYISDGYLVQKIAQGAIGSSTMPQKINPIKFENAEGNLGISNALLEFISSKILISRFQRDLSDSTVLRWIGVPFGSGLLAYKNISRGMSSLEPNTQFLIHELTSHWEMLAEPIQQILRREGISDAYDLLKQSTQGKEWTKDDIHRFIESLTLKNSVKQLLTDLKPETYLGYASRLTKKAIQTVERNIVSIKNRIAR